MPSQRVWPAESTPLATRPPCPHGVQRGGLCAERTCGRPAAARLEGIKHFHQRLPQQGYLHDASGLFLSSTGSSSNASSSTSPPHLRRYPSPPSSPPSAPLPPLPQPKTCKMLLVGLRHSGKTTIIKQLKYLYDYWSRDELRRFIPDILERCIVAMKSALRT